MSMSQHRPIAGPLGLPLVLIRGAGDLASGVAIRLFRSGFPVVMTEVERPLAVRRTVSFAQAVYDGETQVEEVHARKCEPSAVHQCIETGEIPVLVDPDAAFRHILRPQIVVDGIMAKTNTGTRIHDAPLVVALGPGFTADRDCHAVIETNRGHCLGRVIWEGRAEEDTGQPGNLPGVVAGIERALRTPVAGNVTPQAEIGDRLRRRDVIARIAVSSGESVAFTAPFAGVLRGLIHPSVTVVPGMKIGDLDPRIHPTFCFTVSDKSLAVGGCVLEAVMSALHRSVVPLPQHQDRSLVQ